MAAQHQFKPLHMSSPHSNLCAALGMIQSYIMAKESLICGDAICGDLDFRSSSLETATALLAALVAEVESLRWQVHSPKVVRKHE